MNGAKKVGNFSYELNMHLFFLVTVIEACNESVVLPCLLAVLQCLH